jgi:hypothetical protein
MCGPPGASAPIVQRLSFAKYSMRWTKGVYTLGTTKTTNSRKPSRPHYVIWQNLKGKEQHRG